MGVSPRTMHVPAGLPLDEATRPELLDVGAANVAARNVRINELGALEKRHGFGALSSDLLIGAERTAGRRIFAHGSEDVPCVIDGTYLDAYSDNAEKWIRMGRVPEASYRLRDLPTSSSGASFLDSEYVNGYLIVAAEPSTGTRPPTAAVIDYATGAVVLPHEDIGTADGHMILASYGTICLAFVYDYTTTGIELYALDTSDLASGWSSITTITATSSPAYPSVCSLVGGAAIVWGSTSSTTRVNVALVSTGGIGDTTSLFTDSNTPSLLDIDAADVLWVTWAIEGSVNECYAIALSTSDLSTVGTVAVADSIATCANLRICAGTTAQTARIAKLDALNDGHLDGIDLTISAGAVTVTTGTRFFSVTTASRPICIGGRYYMAVAPSPTTADITGNTEQGLCVFADWTENDSVMRPVANIEPGLVPGLSWWAKINEVGTGLYAFGIQLLKAGSRDLAALWGGAGVRGLALVELDFVSRERWQTAQVGSSTFLGGGLLAIFDGARIVESGFLARPQAPAVDTSGGVSLTAAVGFRYVAIYSDVEANGNWTVSGISTPSASTGAFTSKTPVVTVPSLSVTSRLPGGEVGAPRVLFYRTTDGGEPPYYFLKAAPIDPSIASVTILDNIPDSNLIAAPKLYAPSLPGTVGEALDRRAPAGLKHITAYADMLVGAKGSSLVYSGQQVYGESTWFSPVFELPITAGGDIVGIATQDGSLVVFKRDRIFIVTGDAPSDNGASGGIQASRLISADCGCIASDSIVATAIGVFFQSDRGIELFTRAQSVEWIGEPVQDTLAAYPNITSAVVDVRNSLVRFSLSNGYDNTGNVTQWNDEAGQGLGGKDLVFDLTLKTWISVDDKGPDDATNLASQHAAYCSGRYTFLTSDGIAYVESDGWLDEAAWIPSSFTLPPWKLGLQQDQRIWEMQLLYEAHSSAGVLVEVAEDYGAFAAVTADKTWTPAAIAALASPQIAIIPRDHGFAMQLRVSDVEPDTLGTGRGFTFIGISSDIAQKSGQHRGMPRLAAGARK